MTHTVGRVEVTVIRWPAEAERRAALKAMGRPVLLLVESEAPPEPMGPLEDWIRLPSSEADIEVRRQNLLAKVEISDPHFGAVGAPSIEQTGVLRFAGNWVALSPLEVRLVVALLARPGAVIPRQQMIEAGWPSAETSSDAPSRNALDAQILRLRRRLLPAGLTIRTVRARGYILDRIEPAPKAP